MPRPKGSRNNPSTVDFVNVGDNANKGDENMTDIINEEVIPETEEINETPEVTNETDNSEEVKSEETEEKAEEIKSPNPFIAVEDIPEFPGQELGKAFATQVIIFRNQFIDYSRMLNAGTLDESPDGIIATAKELAESGNEALFIFINAYVEAQAKATETLNALIGEVKKDESLKVKTPAELAEIATLANNVKTQINSSLNNIIEFEKLNPSSQSIQAVIDWLKELPALPAIKGSRSTPTRIGSSGTKGVARPRLNGGYIKVGDKSFTSITLALPEINSKSDIAAVNAGDVLSAWLAAANKNDWNETPVNRDITFKIGKADVTIHRKSN